MAPGWLSLLTVFGSCHDPGVLGSGHRSGSLVRGEPASLSPSGAPPVRVPSVSVEKINKILKHKKEVTGVFTLANTSAVIERPLFC